MTGHPAPGTRADGLPIIRAMTQTSSEVTVRHPGNRFLSAPQPIVPYAQEHRDFGWLSVVAYAQTPAAHDNARKNLRRTAPAGGGDVSSEVQSVTDTAEAALDAAGWTRWEDFPDDGVLEKIAATHLRVEVWERIKTPTRDGAIAVTFGGTVFNSKASWCANLRWFIPGHRDQYSDVVQTFAPAFAEHLAERFKDSPRAALTDLALYATGHSLGGGLAQQFAYSVPPDCPLHVCSVYAFDPSPVTGFYSVQKSLRESNRQGLFIDRIYERGEILALLRSLTSLIRKPTACNAMIRGVRYALFHSWNPVGAHSIDELAEKLDAAAGGGGGP